MPLGPRRRCGHDDIDVADAGARDEGLGAVRARSGRRRPRRGAQGRRVGARARLGQAVAGDQLHRAQVGQIARAQRLVAEAVDHPRRHVVDRDEGRGRDAAGGQLLEDERRIEPAQADAAVLLADIDAGEAQLGRLAQRRRPGNACSRPTRPRAAPAPRPRTPVPRPGWRRPAPRSSSKPHRRVSPGRPSMQVATGGPERSIDRGAGCGAAPAGSRSVRMTSSRAPGRGGGP